jgi:hypothetical protein
MWVRVCAVCHARQTGSASMDGCSVSRPRGSAFVAFPGERSGGCRSPRGPGLVSGTFSSPGARPRTFDKPRRRPTAVTFVSLPSNAPKTAQGAPELGLGLGLGLTEMRQPRSSSKLSSPFATLQRGIEFGRSYFSGQRKAQLPVSPQRGSRISVDGGGIFRRHPSF